MALQAVAVVVHYSVIHASVCTIKMSDGVKILKKWEGWNNKCPTDGWMMHHVLLFFPLPCLVVEKIIISHPRFCF